MTCSPMLNMRLDNSCGSCDLNQYSANFICQNCHSSCATCSAASYLDCTSCSDPSFYLRDNHSCGLCP